MVPISINSIKTNNLRKIRYPISGKRQQQRSKWGSARYCLHVMSNLYLWSVMVLNVESSVTSSIKCFEDNNKLHNIYSRTKFKMLHEFWTKCDMYKTQTAETLQCFPHNFLLSLWPGVEDLWGDCSCLRIAVPVLLVTFLWFNVLVNRERSHVLVDQIHVGSCSWSDNVHGTLVQEHILILQKHKSPQSFKKLKLYCKATAQFPIFLPTSVCTIRGRCIRRSWTMPYTSTVFSLSIWNIRRSMAMKVPVRPTPALSEQDREEPTVSNLVGFMLDVSESSFEKCDLDAE